MDFLQRRSIGQFALLWGVGSLLLCGCQVAERVETSEVWPLNWNERELFSHEGQLAYATSGSAAAEAAKVVIEVADQFREITGEEPGSLLLIVLDEDDSPPVEQFADRLPEVIEESRHILGSDSETPFELPISGGNEPPISVEQLVTLVPLFSKPGTISPLPFTATDTLFVALVPTTDHRASVITDLINAALEAQDLGFWQRTLMSPVLPVVKRLARKLVEKISQVFIFQSLLTEFPQWTREEKDHYRSVFIERVGIDPDTLPGFSESEWKDHLSPEVDRSSDI